MSKRYCLFLTKSEVNKLYALVKENKASKTPATVRNRLFDLWVMANDDVIVNGGGA